MILVHECTSSSVTVCNRFITAWHWPSLVGRKSSSQSIIFLKSASFFCLFFFGSKLFIGTNVRNLHTVDELWNGCSVMLTGSGWYSLWWSLHFHAFACGGNQNIGSSALGYTIYLFCVFSSVWLKRYAITTGFRQQSPQWIYNNWDGTQP